MNAATHWHSVARCSRIQAISSWKRHKGTVAVAMSGGIDSSAVALLLQNQGYDCVGIIMKNWDFSDEAGAETCPFSEDKKDMQSVCERLRIPSLEVDFTKEYWNKVFTPFLDSYSTGFETPNPDVFCNKFVKFYHLKNYVQNTLGIKTLATGHYARVNNNLNGYGGTGSQVQLLKGVDSTKDQSYFLSMTPGHLFEDVLFPLGWSTKKEVKEAVKSRFDGLNVLQKKESMGICFIGKRPLKSFLTNYINMTPGRFVEYETGRVVGRHDGLETYTIGQGAKISGSAKKYFIVDKYHPLPLPSGDSSSSNKKAVAREELRIGDILVVDDPQHAALFKSSMRIQASTVNWISGAPPDRLLAGESVELSFKARYAQPTQPCSVQLLHNTSNSNGNSNGNSDNHIGDSHGDLMVRFAAPQRALTPGQIFVLYDQNRCLGGAVIK